MGTRRQAREATLQMLYLCDNCGYTPEQMLAHFYHTLGLRAMNEGFAQKLFTGTWEKRAALDKLITKHAHNWELNRMACIDRNILRLAAFEFMEMQETPISVIIDEAVEIAKRFSTTDSGKFVNGILDKLKIIRTQAGH
jgi:transcription antitermination protein NusB